MRVRRVSLCSLTILTALLLQQGCLPLVPLAPLGQPVLADSDPQDLETLFEETTYSAGLLLTHRGRDKTAGQAWGDYDHDGWLDLYVTDTEGPNVLYHNQGDGTFVVSPLSGQVSLEDAHSGGASFADYDNDGWKDLYVVNWGPNALFRNLGGGGFEDVTAVAGVGDPANGHTASWGDYDSDGYLDLYVASWACYPECGRPATGDLDRLYHNNGDGTFGDATELLGSKVLGAGFVASFVDLDNDGDLDIYVVNDQYIHPIGNKLWRNDGPGCDGWCFTEVATEANADQKVMGMGLATGDYDNDGDMDLFFTNAGPQTLLQNQGDGTFVNVADSAGVRFPETVSFGAVLFDYNNDGWKDLYIAKIMEMEMDEIPANPLFHNNGDGTFTQLTCAVGASDPGGSIGVATADYDNDGWVDLVVGNYLEGYRLYRNRGVDLETGNHWFSLRLEGATSQLPPVNRDAVGAWVTLRTKGGPIQVVEVQNGGSMGSGNDLALHFGLGDQRIIEHLEIRWPDGKTQSFSDVPGDRLVTVGYPLDAAAQDAQREALYPPVRFGGYGPTPAATLVVLATAGVVIGMALLFWLAARSPARSVWLQGAGLVMVLFATVLLVSLLPQWLSSLIPASDRRSDAAGDLDAQLRRALEAHSVQPLEEVPEPEPARVALGEALFWDPLLSGNQDTACVTCHHPSFGTGDGLSLPAGTGGHGIGSDRELGEGRDLVPRNANPLFDLGHPEWEVMFWDGRVSQVAPGVYDTPAGGRLPDGLENVLAAQALFPVTSRDEMRGKRGDQDTLRQKNELSAVRDHEVDRVWAMLMDRLLAVPEYRRLFETAYPSLGAEKFDIADVANAIAAYESSAFSFYDSPFDRYLQGEQDALTTAEKEGALLFFGSASCASCHSGSLLTDQAYHNLAVPLVGPGKDPEEPLDYGRYRVSGDACDKFAFRTPPLRNVTITGPWMHNGAYTSLEAVIRHHVDPVSSLLNYDPAQLAPETQPWVVDDPALLQRVIDAPSLNANPVPPLTDAQIESILAFLQALTSPTATNLEHLIPDSVPSGLPVGGL